MKSSKASKSQKSRQKNIFIDWVDNYGGPKLAKELGIDESTISHWRSGSTPKVEHMRRIRKISKGHVTYGHIIDGGRA